MQNSMNIALLGNCTTEYLGKAFKEQCNSYSIPVNIYNSPFNQYYQEILDESSNFYCSSPQVTIFLLEGRLLFPQWFDFDTLWLDKTVKDGFVHDTFNNIINLVEKIHSKSTTKIIFNNFTIPYHSPLGIMDNKYLPGLKQMILSLNTLLEEYASNKDYLYIFDYNGLCSYIGQSAAESKKMFYLTKSNMSLSFVKILSQEYMRYILPLNSKNKKCIVLDLDNTLWGGIAGEDGINGVSLDISGKGQSFYEFQIELLNLYKRGIILCLNSKNNYEDAIDIIQNHPNMVLRTKHFACTKINWIDKVQNLRDIAKEINIGLDSIVFIDDNPVEREFVKTMLPEVMVINLPEDTSKYADTIRQIISFEILNLTEEDKKRNQMYAENNKRTEAQQQFKNRDEYLASLQTKITIEKANAFTIPRLAQLTQKTNQFNMTTIRYQVSELEQLLSTGNYQIFACTVTDKFGDNGLTGCCIVKIDGNRAIIDSFLLSCRVLGRNVEYAFLGSVIHLLIQNGIQHIEAKFVSTQKNKANEDFYLSAGFTKITSSEIDTIYSLEVLNKLKVIEYIDVEVY